MDEQVVVHSTGNLAEAEVIRAFLSGQGLPVQMQSESLGRISGITSGPLSEAKLLVSLTDAHRARQLIAQGTQDATIQRQLTSAPRIRFFTTLLLWVLAVLVIVVIFLFIFKAL